MTNMLIFGLTVTVFKCPFCIIASLLILKCVWKEKDQIVNIFRNFIASSSTPCRGVAEVRWSQQPPGVQPPAWAQWPEVPSPSNKLVAVTSSQLPASTLSITIMQCPATAITNSMSPESWVWAAWSLSHWHWIVTWFTAGTGAATWLLYNCNTAIASVSGHCFAVREVYPYMNVNKCCFIEVCVKCFSTSESCKPQLDRSDFLATIWISNRRSKQFLNTTIRVECMDQASVLMLFNVWRLEVAPWCDGDSALECKLPPPEWCVNTRNQRPRGHANVDIPGQRSSCIIQISFIEHENT